MGTLNCNLGLNLFDEPFTAVNELNCGLQYYCTYGEGNCVPNEEGQVLGGDQYFEEGTSYVHWIDGYTNTCGGVINSGANAVFILPLSRLEDMGIVVEPNIRCFVVHEGNIVSTGSQYRPEYGNAISCAIWGDMPDTPQVEIMPDNSPIEFYFINGSNIYRVTNLTNLGGNIVPSNWTNNAIFTIFPNVSQIELYCTQGANTPSSSGVVSSGSVSSGITRPTKPTKPTKPTRLTKEECYKMGCKCPNTTRPKNKKRKLGSRVQKRVQGFSRDWYNRY